MDLQLEGRRAVVTGGSAGIGRGIAECLAREGVTVAVVARRRQPLEELADKLAGEGLPRPTVITGDTTVPGDLDSIVERAMSELGGIDILVNSAGGRVPSGLGATDEEWDIAMTLNFDAQRRLTQRLLPQMSGRGWGRIIYITGKSEPVTASGVYAAKAAMHAFAKGLSREMGKHGITVNCLAPGRILTEQMRQRYTDADRAEHVRQIPVGRYGEPLDIGQLATFLSSPLGGYISGAVIPVDGGMRWYQF